VQAGRYAAALDPRLPICGGASPSPPGTMGSPIMPTELVLPDGEEPCTLMVSNMVVGHGETNCLQIILKAKGNENTVGFSISFETDLLKYISARGGSGIGASVLINSNEVAFGRLGFLIGRPAGTVFSEGENVIAEICFKALTTEGDASSTISMIDEPIYREVDDIEALPVPVNYQNGTVAILGPQFILINDIETLVGGGVHLNLSAGPRVIDLEVSNDLINWEPLSTVTNTTGMIDYTDVVPPNSPQRFYRAKMR